MYCVLGSLAKKQPYGYFTYISKQALNSNAWTQNKIKLVLLFSLNSVPLLSFASNYTPMPSWIEIINFWWDYSYRSSGGLGIRMGGGTPRLSLMDLAFVWVWRAMLGLGTLLWKDSNLQDLLVVRISDVIVDLYCVEWRGWKKKKIWSSFLFFGFFSNIGWWIS